MSSLKTFDWPAFTPAAADTALPRLLAESETAVARLEQSSPADSAAFLAPLDDATRDLWRTWGAVSHMTSVMNSDAWRKVEETWQPKIVAFSLRVGQSPRLYAHAKRLSAAETSPVRRRILDKLVESAELAGVGLVGISCDRFNEIQTRLAQLSMDFSNAVIDATAAFKFEKGGKTYTIDDAAYPETMKHCPDRAVREALCRARSTRAPENSSRIDEILALRREIASLLGYPDYATVSLKSKCAPSVAAVFAQIDALDAATAAPAAREESELAALADVSPVEPWDRAFFAERLREKRYAYSEDELKRHFPLESVLAGLWRITKTLFDVEVAEISGDAKPPVWHPDVRFFEVREKGTAIAGFYLDPYVRNGQKRGGAWMNEFSNRARRADGYRSDPIATLVLNLPLPDAAGVTLLPMREVETLFHEFGHALQCMLTRVDEEDAAGINLVEWDAVEVASQFMENWCLDDRTGIVLPPELKKKVLAAKNFRAASACRRQLAFAATDMLLHTSPSAFALRLRPSPSPFAFAPLPPTPPDCLRAKRGVASGESCDHPRAARTFSFSPDAVKRDQFARFGLATVTGDCFLCAFTHIFAGGYAAGYYGYKWAEVMSADCYGAFEEAGLSDDAAVRRLGQKYRETILALGGSASALEVFRSFRGREPSPAALLRQQGLS